MKDHTIVLESLLPWFDARKHSWEVYAVCTSPVHLGFPALTLGLWIVGASTRNPLHHDCSPEISPTAVHLDTQTQYSASQLLHILKSLSLCLHSASYIPVALYSWCWSIISTPFIPTQHPVTSSLTPHLLLAHKHTHKFLLLCCKGQTGNHIYVWRAMTILRFLAPYVAIIADCTPSISVDQGLECSPPKSLAACTQGQLIDKKTATWEASISL